MELKFIEQKEQTTMAIRRSAPEAGLGPLMDECLGILWEYIIKNGGMVCAEPYVAYINEVEGDLTWGKGWDMEIGFPVETALPNEGEIYASKIPAGRCVATTLKGSYSGLGGAWTEFWSEILAQGLAPNGSPRDHYLNDPSMVEEEDLVTNLVVPIQ